MVHKTLTIIHFFTRFVNMHASFSLAVHFYAGKKHACSRSSRSIMAGHCRKQAHVGHSVIMSLTFHNENRVDRIDFTIFLFCCVGMLSRTILQSLPRDLHSLLSSGLLHLYSFFCDLLLRNLIKICITFLALERGKEICKDNNEQDASPSEYIYIS